MMEAINNEKLFSERINARLKSEEWDLGVARDVFRRRRRKRYILGASGSVGSMAAAVLVALFLTAAPHGSKYGEGLNSFVNAQVQGTYRQVFDDKQATGSDETVFVEAEYDASVDTMIDETLSERL
jgi:hypothetical protein